MFGLINNIVAWTIGAISEFFIKPYESKSVDQSARVAQQYTDAGVSFTNVDSKGQVMGDEK